MCFSQPWHVCMYMCLYVDNHAVVCMCVCMKTTIEYVCVYIDDHGMCMYVCLYVADHHVYVYIKEEPC